MPPIGVGGHASQPDRYLMLRAIITALAMSLVVLVLGTTALLIGLIYPSKRVIAVSSVIWSRIILFLSGVRLTIEGKERVADGVPRFYMGNHQSALDIPILLEALDGQVRFMAKDTLFHIPIFGWVLLRYGYAPIDRSSPRVTLRTLDRMLERLSRSPISLAVFPEGTRSPDGKLLAFRRGTMKVGQRSGLPIVPFTIDGSLAVYNRQHFAAHPGPVKLIFAEPIPAEEVAAMSTTELHDRVKAVVARQLGQNEELHRCNTGSPFEFSAAEDLGRQPVKAVALTANGESFEPFEAQDKCRMANCDGDGPRG